jgi:hypothetical protein
VEIGEPSPVPKTFAAEEWFADDLLGLLHEHPHLKHLRVRRRGSVLTIVSGPKGDSVPHARVCRISSQLWILEIATHTGNWQPTGHRALLPDLARTLVEGFPWVLAPIG